MSGTYIYGLSDPRDVMCIWYVGKANNLASRLRGHVWNAKNLDTGNTRLLAWLRSLLDAGFTPEITVLEKTTLQDWETKERAWIAYYRARNSKLCNISTGGNGLGFCSTETRKRMSEGHMGLQHSPETRRKIGLSQIGNKRGSETSAKISASAKLRGTSHMNTPEARANKSKALNGRPHSESHKEALRAAALRRFCK